mmetsp:Transcript_14405/g.34467  ORF Transcript_14405/g.34467 Transcript_14405/m.34467 type:complete len:280 (+) Transcript_14405:108-947(+)
MPGRWNPKRCAVPSLQDECSGHAHVRSNRRGGGPTSRRSVRPGRHTVGRWPRLLHRPGRQVRCQPAQKRASEHGTIAEASQRIWPGRRRLPGQSGPRRRISVEGPPRPGHRIAARHVLRWRHADRPGGRRALRHAGLQAEHHGGQVGPHPGHVGQRHAARAGAHRRGERIDHDGTSDYGRGGGGAGPRHPMRRGSQGGIDPAGQGGRRPVAGFGRRREAAVSGDVGGAGGALSEGGDDCPEAAAGVVQPAGCFGPKFRREDPLRWSKGRHYGWKGERQY